MSNIEKSAGVAPAAPVKTIKKVELDEKKVFKSIFWRQFPLLGTLNFTRMQGLGYAWAIAPVLKKIYPDHQDYIDSLKRNSMFFNTTQALAPFVMGLTVSMEKENAENPEFDPAAIDGIKVGLMGPLAGIGDTFFYSTLRVIITGLTVGLATAGNVLGPILYLLLYNIPNYLIRYWGCVSGYRLGASYITKAQESGLLKCITKAASIMGLIMVGAMTYSMVTANVVFTANIGGQKFVLKTILDSIFVGIIPLGLTLGTFAALKKKLSTNWVLLGLAVIGFVAGFFHILG